VGRREVLMQRSDMPVQSVLLALGFFFWMFYFRKYSSKLGRYVNPMQVSKFICAVLVKLEVWVHQVFMLFFCNLLFIGILIYSFFEQDATISRQIIFFEKNILHYEFYIVKCAHNQSLNKSIQGWMWSVVVAQRL
jgi:hypothetical protein